MNTGWQLQYLFLLSLCICFQAERGIFDLISLLRLFRQLRRPATARSAETRPRQTLLVLLPVLREQSLIEETVLRFCEIDSQHFEIRVVVVTTEREELGGTARTTEEVLLNSLKAGSLSRYRQRIHVFRDPNLNGNMATQVNYAIHQLIKAEPVETFYMLYNADSIVSATTFDALANLFQQRRGNEFAIQQPCAFVRDMRPDSKQFTNALSLYQSWYCLSHESREIWAYEKKICKLGKRRGNTKLGVVVGHGSGMRLGTNIENGGYPADLVTEDLTFGFILSANSVPIILLPSLELADVPDEFIKFLRQKGTWFWNFLSYPRCYLTVRRNGHPRGQALPLLAQGVGAGAYWFFDTVFIMCPFLMSFLSDSFGLFLLSLMSVIVFYILPQYFLLKQLPEVLYAQGFPVVANHVRHVSFRRLFPSLCLIILTNSVGAWIATLNAGWYFFLGREPIKYKTGD